MNKFDAKLNVFCSWRTIVRYRTSSPRECLGTLSNGGSRRHHNMRHLSASSGSRSSLSVEWSSLRPLAIESTRMNSLSSNATHNSPVATMSASIASRQSPISGSGPFKSSPAPCHQLSSSSTPAIKHAKSQSSNRKPKSARKSVLNERLAISEAPQLVPSPPQTHPSRASSSRQRTQRAPTRPSPSPPRLISTIRRHYHASRTSRKKTPRRRWTAVNLVPLIVKD